MKKSFVTIIPNEDFGNKALSVNCDIYSGVDNQEKYIIAFREGTEIINLVTNNIW